MRLRLGAAGPDEPAVCGRCGVSLLDASTAHALCCANAVVGHNDVRDELHAAACACDPSAELESLGLIPSHPMFRPVDIVASAHYKPESSGQQSRIAKKNPESCIVFLGWYISKSYCA